jgi:gamma-tubulin complex component 5
LLQILRAKFILERLRLLKDLAPDSEGDRTENEFYYHLRQRLLWLTNILYSHMTETVLAGSESVLRDGLSKSGDPDGMIEAHWKHISSLEAQCLLAKRLAPIRQAILSLLDLAILFSDAHAAHAGEKSFDVTNRSFSLHASQLLPNSYRHGKRYRRDEDLSSDEDETSEGEADTSYISFMESPYLQHLKKMDSQFQQLCGFVSTGLRGVSRVAGEPTWDMLAEKLEWGMGPKEDLFGV